MRVYLYDCTSRMMPVVVDRKHWRAWLKLHLQGIYRLPAFLWSSVCNWDMLDVYVFVKISVKVVFVLWMRKYRPSCVEDRRTSCCLILGIFRVYFCFSLRACMRIHAERDIVIPSVNAGIVSHNRHSFPSPGRAITSLVFPLHSHEILTGRATCNSGGLLKISNFRPKNA